MKKSHKVKKKSYLKNALIAEDWSYRWLHYINLVNHFGDQIKSPIVGYNYHLHILCINFYINHLVTMLKIWFSIYSWKLVGREEDKGERPERSDKVVS